MRSNFHLCQTTASCRLAPVITSFTLTLLVVLTSFGSVLAGTSSWEEEVGDVVYATALSGDGSVQIVGSRNNRVAAYDSQGNLIWEFHPGGTVWGADTSDSGQWTVIACEDRQVYLLNAQGQEVWTFRSPRIFLDAAISLDGSRVAAVAENRQIYFLDGETGQLLWQYSLPNIANAVAVYGQKTIRVLAGTRDSQLHLLGSNGHELWRAQLADHVLGVTAVDSGARIVVGTLDGKVTLLNGANTQVIWQVQLPDRVLDVDISGDGERVAAGIHGGKAYILNGIDGTVVQEHKLKSPVEAVSISRDGDALLFGTRAGQALSLSTQVGAARYATHLQLRRGLAIGIPIGFLLLIIATVLWIQRTESGRQFWSVRAQTPRATLRQMWRSRTSYLFLVPTVLLLLVFNYYPAISGLYHAFTVWKPGVETRWVGLQQFR